MAVPNVDPIYSRVGDVQWIGAITAANNTKDLTTGTSYLVYTADATSGGFVSFMRVKADPAANTAATVVRVWLNNGSTTGTAVNSILVTEATFAVTIANAAAATAELTIPLNFAMPPGFRLYVTVGTAPGGSGQLSVAAFAGKY